MAFKFIVLAAFVAIAKAGGPAAYDIGTVSADHNSIGYSQESTQKGYAGQNVLSTYSRAEDSAHSSVRVSNSHASNDILLDQPSYGYSYAAPALAKPLIAAQPLIAKTAYAAAAPALATYAAQPAPLIAKAAYAAAPAYGYAAPAALSYSSPLLAKTYAAPAPLIAKTAAYTTYAASATPLIAKAAYAAPAYAAPAYAASAYAAPAYAAPAYASYSSPLLAKTYAAPIASAPILAKTAIAAAPSLAYAAPAAPVIAKTYAAPYSYETGAPIVHASFTGFGTSYAW